MAAFASDFSEPEFEAERPLFEPERLVNAFDGEERVGSAGAFSMRLTVPGGDRPGAAASPRSASSRPGRAAGSCAR